MHLAVTQIEYQIQFEVPLQAISLVVAKHVFLFSHPAPFDKQFE